MNKKNLGIREFDPREIKPGSVCVFIGKRNSGKSFLMKDILYHKKDYPVVRLICETEGYNHAYENLIPRIFIDHKFDEQILKNLFKRQKIILNKNHKENTNIDPRSLLIFDDLLASSKEWRNNQYVKSLFMNGRHLNIDFMLSMQYAIGIDPELRTQIDYIFFCKELKNIEREKIYENYASAIPKELFNSVFSKLTENYSCMVIKNVSSTAGDKKNLNKKTSWLDQVFYYKAVEHKNFRLCSQSAWDASLNYQSEDSDEEDNKNIRTVKNKKNDLKIKFI